MTLPDKLTISRIYCTPLIFSIWFLSFQLDWNPRVGTILLLFLFAWGEISDVLDGFIARKHKIVSDLGKLLDPFSDIFLRLTYFLCFTISGIMPVWAMAIILWRELGIMFVRIMLVRKGITLAANPSGKLKAVLYFFSGFGGIVYLAIQTFWPGLSWLPILLQVLFCLFSIAAAAALLSFIIYFRYFLASYGRSGAAKV